MLSRIADSLFWLNRYMERADGMLRLISTHYIFSLDKDVNGTMTWMAVMEIFIDGDEESLKSIEHNTEECIKRLLIDTSNTNCLKTLVNKARENARGVQDHITKEVWEEVNSMYHFVNQSFLQQKIDSFLGLEVMEPLIKHTVLYAGITDITMPRGIGWWFMHLGYELHVKTYRSGNHNYNVLHQILLNENFTRSVMYSLTRIEYYLHKIIGNNVNEERALLLRNFGRLFSKVRYMELDSLNKDTVPVFFEELKADLVDFNQKMVQHFFSYA
jgi:uncharacterized alpha-E superfamily protein